ncbi:MAG: aminoacyl-tRNA hydrolase [Erysipelothrix sp.]|nr:aminoacyl-tRNA hydrolase [Erysipelothrix sp.]
MKLIVGLGNPGRTYAKTRHNTGFLVIDKLCEYYGVSLSEKKFKNNYIKFKVNQQDVILTQPQTFMNLSGEAVSQLANYFKVETNQILVISDDLDLPVGKVRFRKSGNDGGQRGVRNIIERLNTKEFNRCRIGIGNDKLIPTADYVLGKVEKENQELYEQSLNHAMKGIIEWINSDIVTTMNLYNGDMTQ